MKQQQLVTQSELAAASANAHKILHELDRILIGRSDLHRMVLIGVLSRGHILLEGLPGVGKTALIKTLGELLKLQFSRVQFTPDLMPGDILGAHILQQSQSGQREMVFQPGPIFTNILLADEINRASPKTQSALLEAMQEKSVTLLGTTRKLPAPFFVLASQNPIELEGTYPLPEAQLDRFIFKLEVKSADVSTLREIIFARRHGEPPAASFTVSAAELDTLFDVMNRIYLPGPVAEYIARLVNATNPGSSAASRKVHEFVQYGASPRAAIAVAETARGVALLAGRPSVGFDDVREVFVPALNHRVLLNYKARFEGITTSALLEELKKTLKETDLGLAEELVVEAENR
ncbi:MAG TPA: AAA family ATPase [Candidatus Riflebacteria bacterium]|jgi:MoxR-like ATPase|nr:MAG: AAA family ATPase [Candidatus Riflebacteria bacterium HGW-Riflebacteria-1]HAE39217.1 AAA family ATPase [Candidatus Riflebacteria bacterium]